MYLIIYSSIHIVCPDIQFLLIVFIHYLLHEFSTFAQWIIVCRPIWIYWMSIISQMDEPPASFPHMFGKGILYKRSISPFISACCFFVNMLFKYFILCFLFQTVQKSLHDRTSSSAFVSIKLQCAFASDFPVIFCTQSQDCMSIILI